MIIISPCFSRVKGSGQPAERRDERSFSMFVWLSNFHTSKQDESHFQSSCKDVGMLHESKERHLCITHCHTKESVIRGVEVNIENSSIQALLVQKWCDRTWVDWLEADCNRDDRDRPS